MKVVTAGSAYLDIDSYGGCIAYAELLRLQGQEAIAASSAPWNQSVTRTVRTWGGDLRKDYQVQVGDQFVLVDVSNPDFFANFVQLDAVTEVIDHHPGFEAYWQERLGERATIAFIGAACTLVYEHYIAAGKFNDISTTSARLLLTGILDNTLNFKAGVTTSRDKEAYEQLMQRADLPADWSMQYFNECQQAIVENLESAITNDVKFMDIKGLPNWLGQLVIWDAADLLQDRTQQIIDSMRKRQGTWAMNVVSINVGKSYFLAEDKGTQAELTKILNVSFQNGRAAADRLWLRKEIMKAALSKA